MAIGVVHVASIVEGEIHFTHPKNRRNRDLIGLLISVHANPAGDGTALRVQVHLTDDLMETPVRMDVEPYLSASDLQKSEQTPLSLGSLASVPSELALFASQYWLFRSDFYCADRLPMESEEEEVLLRIKAQYFQRSDKMNRLREQVANFEAIDRVKSAGASRQTIPEDVKLLVWARDGGHCVKCGASKDLHFDHIIPLSRGGGDHGENIQLLCRTCNLSKGARLV